MQQRVKARDFYESRDPLPGPRIDVRRFKTVPTEEFPAAKRASLPWHRVCRLISGNVDIGPLRERVASLPAEAWTASGQTDNAWIVRAAHDRHGVGKIMFSFSDDIFTRVYRFPWWQVGSLGRQ